VKKLRRSVNICQSYRKNKSGTFLWTTVYFRFQFWPHNATIRPWLLLQSPSVPSSTDRWATYGQK